MGRVVLSANLVILGVSKAMKNEIYCYIEEGSVKKSLKVNMPFCINLPPINTLYRSHKNYGKSGQFLS